MSGPNARLIVNADDFGLSEGVNRGIIEAHRSGIVTSTSLMVRAGAAESAVELGRDATEMSVGLHLDLGEWRYENGYWAALYERAPLDDADLLEREVAAQVEMFVRLTGSTPTHMDAHQHAHRNEPLRSIVVASGASMGIPVRHFTPSIRYLGDFYGQNERGERYSDRVSADFLSGAVAGIGDELTELCCHPAQYVDFDSTYSIERLMELKALCDPKDRAAIGKAGVTLCSFLTWDM